MTKEHATTDRTRRDVLTQEIRSALRLLRAGASCERCHRPAAEVRTIAGRARSLCALHATDAALDHQLTTMRAERERRPL